MAGASGARSWLQAQHITWLNERRMKQATVGVFVAAALGSTVTLSGSSMPPPHQLPGHAIQHTTPR